MKIIVNRDFREIINPPEWITLDDNELQKNKWKTFGTKSNYLNIVYPSSWRIVFGGKNTILNEDSVLILLEKSFSNYFSDENLIEDLHSRINTLENPNLKKKKRLDEISFHIHSFVTQSLYNFLSQNSETSLLDNVEDFLLTHPEFTYSIPFIDPKMIIENNTRKNRWDKNSIESFLRSNVLIQVKTTNLEDEGIGIGLFLRKDLKLGKGKTGAQLSHGAVSLLYQSMYRNNYLNEFIKKQDKNLLFYTVKDLKVLNQIQNWCLQLKINHSYIQDAGHTQIDPGTATVIAVGPIPLIWLRILGFNMEAVELV